MSSEATVCLSNPLPKSAENELPAYSPLRNPRSKSESSTHITAIGNSTNKRSDEDLLQQVTDGSKEALSVLFQRYARPVYSVGQRILKDTSEAEDLLQELFLFLFQKAKLFDPAKGSGASWIIQMAYHRALDRRRYLNSRHHYSSQEFKVEHLPNTQGQSLVSEVDGRALLNKAREELSPEQQQTLELHFFEGYSLHEIARQTDQTYGNVRHHLYRGLERLRSYVFRGKSV